MLFIKSAATCIIFVYPWYKYINWKTNIIGTKYFDCIHCLFSQGNLKYAIVSKV